MIVISLANENTETNSIVIELGQETMSLRDVEGLEQVVEFFKGNIDVEEDLVSFNGLDVAALRNIGGLEVDDDTVLEFTSYGENASKIKKKQRVSIYINGNFQFKETPICEGTTQVKDIIDQELADFFNVDIKEVKKMRAQINDTDVDNSAFLSDGDEVMFMSRKAGTKGCDDSCEEGCCSFRSPEYNEGDAATVIVYSPAGIAAHTINIEHKVTPLSEVVLSPKILKANAMTSAQAATLMYCINEIEVNLDAILEANDVITMYARRAGTKGM